MSNKHNNNHQKKDPSSMSGLVNETPAETTVATPTPEDKAAIDTAIAEGEGTTSPEANNPNVTTGEPGLPTPEISDPTETPEEEEARLAAELEAAEAAEREEKAKLKKEAEAEAERKAAEQLAKSHEEAQANDKKYKLDNSKFNERQFLEILKATIELFTSQEKHAEFIALGFPPAAFVPIAEVANLGADKAYKINATILNDRHFIEILKLSLNITLKQTAVDKLIAAGFPLTGFEAI